MSTFQHPAFDSVRETVPDERDADMVEHGWLPLADDPQTPPPPAVRNSSNHPSGLGKFRRETA